MARLLTLPGGAFYDLTMAPFLPRAGVSITYPSDRPYPLLSYRPNLTLYLMLFFFWPTEVPGLLGEDPRARSDPPSALSIPPDPSVRSYIL